MESDTADHPMDVWMNWSVLESSETVANMTVQYHYSTSVIVFQLELDKTLHVDENSDVLEGLLSDVLWKLI